MKFSNYKSVWHNITMADGRSLAGVGIGDLHIELPNGSRKSKLVLETPYMYLAWHLPRFQSVGWTRPGF